MAKNTLQDTSVLPSAHAYTHIYTLYHKDTPSHFSSTFSHAKCQVLFIYLREIIKAKEAMNRNHRIQQGLLHDSSPVPPSQSHPAPTCKKGKKNPDLVTHVRIMDLEIFPYEEQCSNLQAKQK